MTLNWKVASVAPAHAIGDAVLGTSRFWTVRRSVRIRITGGRRIPQAAEQRLENVLSRGGSPGGDKSRDGGADHEDAFDAAAQAALATGQQSEGLPVRRQLPRRTRSKSGAARGEYCLRAPGGRRFD